MLAEKKAYQKALSGVEKAEFFGWEDTLEAVKDFGYNVIHIGEVRQFLYQAILIKIQKGGELRKKDGTIWK